MKTLQKHITQQRIRFLEKAPRDDVVRHLAQTMCETVEGVDPEALMCAVMEREKIVTTGIGMGVAIPHAKLASFDNFVVSLGILSDGVDWNALDGNPVRLVFLIGGPENRQTEYLQILSSITHAVKTVDLRKKLLQAKSADEAFAELSGY